MLQGNSLPSSTTVVALDRSDDDDVTEDEQAREKRFVDFVKVGRTLRRLFTRPPGNPGYVFPPPR